MSCRDGDVTILKIETFSSPISFCKKHFPDDIVNKRFRDARYIRCGVNGELMLYIVSFKNAGYADT